MIVPGGWGVFLPPSGTIVVPGYTPLPRWPYGRWSFWFACWASTAPCLRKTCSQLWQRYLHVSICCLYKRSFQLGIPPRLRPNLHVRSLQSDLGAFQGLPRSSVHIATGFGVFVPGGLHDRGHSPTSHNQSNTSLVTVSFFSISNQWAASS